MMMTTNPGTEMAAFHSIEKLTTMTKTMTKGMAELNNNKIVKMMVAKKKKRHHCQKKGVT